MPGFSFIPLSYKKPDANDLTQRAHAFLDEIKKRRSVRTFSNEAFPKEIIENCILAAGSAPSGANMQPWHFVIVSNPDLKKKIREAAEKEERAFYNGRTTKEWLTDLEKFGTDADKPFLETAPYLIVIFEKKFDVDEQGTKKKLYYTKESVGIATGFLITALHQAGLVSLTHTPSPMNFLNDLLQRPPNEKPFLILITGYPAEETLVPEISKKYLPEISTSFM